MRTWTIVPLCRADYKAIFDAMPPETRFCAPADEVDHRETLLIPGTGVLITPSAEA